MQVHIVTQFSFCFPDKPGVLAKTGKAFADADINMTGMLNISQGSATVTRMVVEGNTAKAQEILKANGATDISQRDILALKLEGKSGTLAGVAEKLVPANINIGDLYASELPGSNAAMIYLNTSDNKKALEVLSK